MTIKSNAALITDIDHENRVIRFDKKKKPKKVTGSRFSTILGKDDYNTAFSVACEMAYLYKDDAPSKHTEAGDVLEPVIRSYVRTNAKEFLSEGLNCSDGDVIGVEEPVPSMMCGHDHFPDGGIFGGMVDGYVLVNGKRVAVLEIKTTNNEAKWIDAETGTRTGVPINYCYQTALYAHLSGLKKIVFAAGFLRDEHYDDLSAWSPDEENCQILIVDAPDISEELLAADKWYEEYLEAGVTPEWTEKDEEIVEYLQSAIQEPPPKDLKTLMSEYAELDKELDTYADVSEKISVIKKGMDERKEAVREYMMQMFEPGQKKRVEEEGHLKFSVTRSVRTDLDRDRMKEDGVYDKYLKEKESFTLSVRKEKEEE
jgi:hypothetical protein